MTELQEKLFSLQDKEYRDFTVKLNPAVDPDTVIGVRLPAIRVIAKELRGTEEAKLFLSALPHDYLEENHLHSFLLSDLRDFDEWLRLTERYLPYIDNWAVCDSMRVKAFGKTPELLLPPIERWIKSDHTYTVRFSILCLMTYFLDDRFDTRYADMVAAVKSDEYYVNMMIAWYFATALAKQYDAVLPCFQERRLGRWVHNKSIQKAVESYRVSNEHKTALKSLRWKEKE